MDKKKDNVSVTMSAEEYVKQFDAAISKYALHQTRHNTRMSEMIEEISSLKERIRAPLIQYISACRECVIGAYETIVNDAIVELDDIRTQRASLWGRVQSLFGRKWPRPKQEMVDWMDRHWRLSHADVDQLPYGERWSFPIDLLLLPDAVHGMPRANPTGVGIRTPEQLADDVLYRVDFPIIERIFIGSAYSYLQTDSRVHEAEAVLRFLKEASRVMPKQVTVSPSLLEWLNGLNYSIEYYDHSLANLEQRHAFDVKLWTTLTDFMEGAIREGYTTITRDALDELSPFLSDLANKVNEERKRIEIALAHEAPVGTEV